MTDTRRTWERHWAKDLGEALWSVATTALGAGIGIGLVDGVTVDRATTLFVFASVVVGVGDLLVAPLLRRMASLGSAPLAIILGIAGQVLVFALALQVAPGVRSTGAGSMLAVIVIAAIVMSLGRWLVGSADSSYVVGHIIRRARARARRTARRADREPRQAQASGAGGEAAGLAAQAPARGKGMLVVQLDGLAPEVLRLALRAGQAPTLARWLVDGSHQLEEWWVRVPCTTPASMAGFLHGDEQEIVAFRWWDRELRRLVVTNNPSDADLVEARLRSGHGLLRGGGVAVSTMFSGEADTTFLVMSRALRGRKGLGPGGSYLSFFLDPFVLPRAVVLTVGEMIKELYQGRRQRVRSVVPRIRRRGGYVVLRGVTNVMLRDLSLALVAEQMTRGAPAIFVDLVDYDEIAHHAGPERPEAMRAIEGVDTVLRQLEQVIDSVSTDYRIVVVSDHGQSLGPTFEQVSGQTLADRVSELMGADVDTVRADSGEEYGPANALIASVLGESAGHPGRVRLGPERRREDVRPGGDELPELAVIGSGNLGMVWFPRFDERPDLATLDATWPDLVPGLTATEGVGLVMVTGPGGGAVVFGAKGVRRLGSVDAPVPPVSGVEGEDPLASYAPQAADDLRRLSAHRHCGDIVLVSSVDELGLVHAFEGLVGSHGGLGGAQNSGLLVHPTEWAIDDDLRAPLGGDGPMTIIGSSTINEQLLRWRKAFGAGPVDAPTGDTTTRD